jgi:hypothetical protein
MKSGVLILLLTLLQVVQCRQGVLAPDCHVWMNGALVFEQARIVVERRCPAVAPPQTIHNFIRDRLRCRFENELADVCIGIGLLQSTVPCWLVDRSTFNTQRSTLSKRAQETAGLLLAQGVDLPLYHVPPHLLEPPTTFTVRPISSFLP